MYKITFLLISFLFASCLPPNIHIMPEYKGKKIYDENLLVVQVRIKDSNNYVLLNKNYISASWLKPLRLATTNLSPKLNDNFKFDTRKDSVRFTPGFLDIAEDILDNSTFKNVYNFNNESIPSLYKNKLQLSDQDSIIMFLTNNQKIILEEDSIKYLLFIQFPEEIYAESGKIDLNLNFCIWDNDGMKIISFGRFRKFSTMHYYFSTEDLKYEIVRRLLIESPFYKGKMTRRIKTEK